MLSLPGGRNTAGAEHGEGLVVGVGGAERGSGHRSTS